MSLPVAASVPLQNPLVKNWNDDCPHERHAAGNGGGRMGSGLTTRRFLNRQRDINASLGPAPPGSMSLTQPCGGLHEVLSRISFFGFIRRRRTAMGPSEVLNTDTANTA